MKDKIMNRNEFKSLLSEWDNNFQVEKKELLNEVSVRDGLIIGLLSVAGISGISYVNKALSSKGEKPAVTSSELNRTKNNLVSMKKNKKMDDFTRQIVHSARNNPGGVALFLSKHGGEDINDIEEVKEEIQDYNSEENPVIKLLARTFEKSKGAENDKISIDGVGEINADSINDIATSGVPSDIEEYMEWQQDLINGDKEKQSKLADYFLDNKIEGADDIQSLDDLDDVFNGLNTSSKVKKGNKDIMKIVSSMDIDKGDYESEEDYESDRLNIESTKQVMNALSRMSSRGAFDSDDRINSLDASDYEDMIDGSDNVTKNLFYSMIDRIKERNRM